MFKSKRSSVDTVPELLTSAAKYCNGEIKGEDASICAWISAKSPVVTPSFWDPSKLGLILNWVKILPIAGGI